MTGGLVAFLRERLAEDERAARDAAQNPDYLKGEKHVARSVPLGGGRYSTYRTRRSPHPEIVTRFDSARVLAEVAAKRRILDRIVPRTDLGDSLLRLLALPYAEHPDYRPEWRP